MLISNNFINGHIGFKYSKIDNVSGVLDHCVAWYQTIRLLYGVLLKEDGDVSIGSDATEAGGKRASVSL